MCNDEEETSKSMKASKNILVHMKIRMIVAVLGDQE